jgi:hypothetical protein
MSIIEGRRAEKSHVWQRMQHEHYVEPEWCSRRLFEVEDFVGPISDPACGFGNILKSAKAATHDVWAADIVDRGYEGTIVQDFFTAPHNPSDIVSNPPFDQFKPFAMRALDVCYEKVALIWLVRTLPAARWLKDTPLARIWFLTPRPPMPPGCVVSHGVGLHGEPQKVGGGKQDFCWLVWDRAHVGAPTVGWLHRDAK